MITNKDVRVENGNLVLNGDKYPLDGQSPEAIMQIVKANSDTTPTENSDAPITSGGVFTVTNVQSVNDIDSLKTANVSACYGTLYKINNLVFLNFTALYTSEMSAGSVALSLPSEFRPSSAVYGNGVILKPTGETYTALVKINPNGNVFGDTSTTGTVITGTIIYTV